MHIHKVRNIIFFNHLQVDTYEGKQLINDYLSNSANEQKDVQLMESIKVYITNKHTIANILCIIY